MPKELTHWWLAAESLNRLPEHSPLRRRIAPQLHAYLLGAVLPDTLLHMVLGAASKTALRLAEQFHEPAGNSFVPLLRLLEQQTIPLKPFQEACLLGVATHMLSDITFHPAICAVAGPDLGEHYRIETALDLWLLHSGRQPPVFRLSTLLGPETFHEELERLLQALFDPDRELPFTTFHAALRIHSLIQGMYGSTGWQILAAVLARLPMPALKSRHQLFYPFGWQNGKDLNWPTSWIDPATGSKRDEAPEQLVDIALTRITALLCTADADGLVAAFNSQPGENLVTGQPQYSARSDHVA